MLALKELYQKGIDVSDEDLERLFLSWEELSYQKPDELSDFIRSAENELASTLADISIVASPIPWTEEDMDRYYRFRHRYLDSKEVSSKLSMRNKALKDSYPLTNYDDLQLSREKKNAQYSANSHDFALLFAQLELLSQAKEILDPRTDAEDYFLKDLFALLAVYRVQLQTEDRSEPQNVANTILKIDGITLHIAKYIHNIINNDQVKNQAENLKALMQQLGSLNLEIFPWVSVLFRKNLLEEKNETCIENLLESFRTFHEVLQQKSSEQGLLESPGIDVKLIITEYLQQEQDAFLGIVQADETVTMRNIKSYLQASNLSSWVVFKLSQGLFNWVKQEDFISSDDFEFIIYRLIDLIEQHPKQYADAYDQVSAIRGACESESAWYAVWEKACPGLVVAILKDNDLPSAIDLALNAGYLPPSAGLLYEMHKRDSERTKFIIQDYSERCPTLVHETFLAIFSEDAFSEQHETFLAANVPQYLETLHQRENYQKTLLDDLASIDSQSKQIALSLAQHKKVCQSWNDFFYHEFLLNWLWGLMLFEIQGYSLSKLNFWGYNLEKCQAQQEHFNEIEAYLLTKDLRNLEECHELIEQLSATISQGTFKQWFWLSSFYHHDLIKLRQKLIALEAKITDQSYILETSATGANHEINSLSLGTSRFGLHRSADFCQPLSEEPSSDYGGFRILS